MSITMKRLVTLARRRIPLSSSINAFDAEQSAYLRWDPESEVYNLKFYGEPERSLEPAAQLRLSFRSARLSDPRLSSRAVGILQDGGVMIIDEIERGLNKSLDKVIIDLFLSSSTNPHGARSSSSTTTIPKILDFLPRKDDVYLLVRDANHETDVVKYSTRSNA